MNNIQSQISALSRRRFSTINSLVEPGASKLPTSFRVTNLDLENNKPNGGPQNDPRSNYVHKFTPINTYAEFIKRYT